MKFRKLLAIGTTVALAFTTLVGCGNDEKSASDDDKKGTFKSSFESGMALESYTYESSVEFAVKGKSFVGTVDDETKELLSIKDDSISAKMNINGKMAGKNSSATLGLNVNDKISADLLDVVMVDNTIYVGIEKFVSGVGKLYKDISGEDISDEINLMKPEGNYIKVTEEMITSIFGNMTTIILGKYYSENLDINDMITDNASIEDKELITYFSGLFDKAISKSESDVYSSDGDKHKLTISNENINKLVKALAEVAESESEEISKKLARISGEEITASQITSVASMLKSYDVAALLGVEFSIEVTTEFDDGTWKLGVSFELIENDESMKISINHKAVEDKDIKISAPTDLVSDEDLEEMMSLFDTFDDELDDNQNDDIF